MQVIEEERKVFVPLSLRIESPFELERVKDALGQYIQRYDISENDTISKAQAKLLSILEGYKHN